MLTLALNFLATLIPSANPRAMLAVIGTVLAAIFLGMIYFAGVQQEHTKTVALDLKWRLELETAKHAAETEANQRAADAADAASRVVPAGPAPADLARLCKEDPACRDKH